MTDNTLHSIQSAVHVAKDKKNDFGGYNYRTAEGILAATKAALPEGADIILTDDLRELAGQIFVCSTATINVGDNSYSATGFALHPLTKKGMDPSQITGSASSYARKYALSGLLALDDGSVDPDSAKEEYKPEIQQAVIDAAHGAETLEALGTVWTANKQWQTDPAFLAAKDKRKSELRDEIPYKEATE